MVGTSDKHVVFGGSWVQFSPRVRKFSLSRASMISPPSKLKMFTGSLRGLLTSVSLKLIKIKIKLIYATTSSWEKTKWRVKGKWRRLILFFFLWSELIRVQFYFIFIFLFDPSRSELIWPGLAVRVDPVRLLSLPIQTSGFLKTQNTNFILQTQFSRFKTQFICSLKAIIKLIFVWHCMVTSWLIFFTLKHEA